MNTKNSLYSLTALFGLLALSACNFPNLPNPYPEPEPYYCEGEYDYCEGCDYEYDEHGCVPVEENYCYADSDCGSNQFCDLAAYDDNYAPVEDVAPEDCYEAEDGSSNCSGGARMRPEGRCENLPPPPAGECTSDYDCDADEYCNLEYGPYETQPAPDCPAGEDCAAMYPAPLGFCEPLGEPPPAGCASDYECGPNAYCEIFEVCEAMPYPDCGPDEDCGRPPSTCEVFSECVPYDPPPPPPYGDCNTDTDCGSDAYCELIEECSSEIEPGCADPAGCREPVPACEAFGQCVPYNPPPPYGECEIDADCGQGAYCEYYEECPDVLPPECGPDEDCDYPYPEYPCEVYSQCVPVEQLEPCSIDADCGQGSRCLIEPNGAESYLSGMCIPAELSDCEEQCIWEIDGMLTECMNNAFDPASQQECFNQVEGPWNECVVNNCGELPPPPPALCEDQCTDTFYRFIDECEFSGAGPECIADAQLYYDACYEECSQEPPPPTCEESCLMNYDEVFWECLGQGQAPNICDQVATPILNACMSQCGAPPTGECSTNTDCGQGGTCQTTEWCETPACTDNNGDGICDAPADGGTPDATCGSESICVYETEPPPDPGCTADDQCAGGVCVVRTSCFFYCEINDPDCCFEVGQCEQPAP